MNNDRKLDMIRHINMVFTLNAEEQLETGYAALTILEYTELNTILNRLVKEVQE